MKQLSLIVGLIGLCAWNQVGVAARLPQMRVSVENSATHVQAKSVKRFADEIEQKLKIDPGLVDRISEILTD